MKKRFGFYSFQKTTSRNKSGQNTEDRKHTYETFDQSPVSNLKSGGAAAGATGDENVFLIGKNMFEQHILGAGQTLINAVLTSVGLNIGLDQTDDEGMEMTQGILSKARHAYTVGTSGQFFFRVKVKVADVSGSDDLAIGFRKAEAYQANLDDYDEMAALNVISGDIKIETILNAGATTTTDTTDNLADLGTVDLKVIVSDAGVVTYTIDGAAPTVTAAFTIDDTEVVVPFLYFLNASDLAGAVEVVEWECGLGDGNNT